MKNQFESLNSDKFSEQKLSVEAMMKQRGGAGSYDTKEHNGDKVSYINNRGVEYIKVVTWGDGCADCTEVTTSNKPFEGVPDDHYSNP